MSPRPPRARPARWALALRAFAPWALAFAAQGCVGACGRNDATSPLPSGPASSAGGGAGGAARAEGEGGESAGGEGAGGESAGGGRGPALAPLAAESWLITLPIEGFGDTLAAVPLGATEPRPVVVALHGIQDRAEWACGEWRGVAGPDPFVLCPRGVPSPGVPRSAGVFAHASAPQTLREIDAGLRALRARFGAHVAEGPSTLVGFSLGANVGSRIAIEHPAAFPRLVLAEGGHGAWTRPAALAFAKGGGRRVLFACSQAACREAVKAPSAALRAAGAEADLAYAGNIGHLVDERVVRSIRARWPFVIEGDERYAVRPEAAAGR
jgi:pimeloyl-ACP methyl ester carboxylesterase